jgi:DNA-binding NarL/FixJ family response regulator
VRARLCALLQQESDLQVVGEATDGLEAVQLVETARPAVLVTDLVMPGLHGLEVVRLARSKSPETLVVVVSVHTEEPYVLASFQNGARAYVCKDYCVTDLVPAVRAVLAGRRHISPPLRETLLAELPD